MLHPRSFCCGLAVTAFALSAWAAPLQAAVSYVISDSTTGYVFEKAASEKKLQIGSLTKIATAMVVLDWQTGTNADLNQLATVPTSAGTLNTPGGLGLAPGDRCSLRDLLYAALMQSDNAASETLADHVGRALGANAELPPVAAFVQQMNALAKAKGMLRTRFLNAHGLDSLERSLPYSTADDLAKLTAYAMANSAFRFYVSQKERKITVVTAAGENSYLLRNTNELLGRNSIDGVKTGTTKRAGQCLIISAARPPESVQKGDTHLITPRRLNVVVLGSTDRFNEAANLLARGWQLYDTWAAAGRPAKAR
ncbi:MAG TPA: serine hydrolase [Chthoniobacteraceae bacterium]|jgi:D-alanyl-D-alanine carboxypeptidase